MHGNTIAHINANVNGELFITQRLGIITLLPKGDKPNKQ